MSNFRIALTAGHYYYTPGKRCLASLDPNETREWVLNDRIADKVEKLLKNYTGYELLRTDDTSGATSRSMKERVKAAESFKADFYLSIHHNAGVKGGKGGGIVSIVSLKPKAESMEWQKELYNELVSATGLRGNRAEPCAKMSLYECRVPTMPSVLLELGFMDSSTDVPVILSEQFANQCATAIVKVLVKRGGLRPLDAAEPYRPLYTVQTGVFRSRVFANNLLAEIKAAGFTNAFCAYENEKKLYRVLIGAYENKSLAEKKVKAVRKAGFEALLSLRQAPELRSIEDVVREVLNGKWGNGKERKERLTAAGYNYAEIQRIVNQLV